MRFFIVILFCLATLKVTAQNNYTAIGTVTDKLNSPLINATVVLLNPSDSTLVKFGITNQEGKFKIPQIKAGDYLVQTAFLSYKTLYQPLKVEGGQALIDLGTLVLEEKTETLNEVVIKGESIPIQIKKDTIEYNASSFKTQQNAVVEELLKQLPGVEVEEDGTIKAQGEEVNKVLVDGKEFFGDDPKIATKNLPADAIDKVQVFDKKSDQAVFTGIEDGQRDKTINLALKEDHKNGIFGNIMAGYGTDNLYDSKANLNRFNKKSQLSLIGSFNNINKQSFSIGDYLNMSGGIAGLMSGGGGRIELNIQGPEAGPLTTDYGSGFITSGSLGINGSVDFSEKISLTSSYFFNNIKNELKQLTERKYFLPDEDFYFENNNLERLTKNSNHRLNLNLNYNIDSTQKLKVRTSVGYNNSSSNGTSRNEILNNVRESVNSSDRINSLSGNNINARTNLTYMKRLNKPGRNLSLRLNGSLNERDYQLRLNAINRFSQGEIDPLIQEIIQRQAQVEDQFNYDARITFTEHLGKKHYLSLFAEQSDYNNNLNQEVYDLIPLEQLNEDLSNQYKRNYIYQKAGLSIKRNRKKSTFSIGGKFQYSSLNGTLNNREDKIEENFSNFLPNLFWNYDFSHTKHLSIQYNTDINAPSLEQLQPIVNNTDPIRVYIGNPNLRPEYRHNANLSFNTFSQFSGISLFANIRGSVVENKITNSRTIDDQFREVTRPINTKNGQEVTGNISFGAPLKFINSRVRISTGGALFRQNVFVNNIENISSNLTNSVKLKFDNKNKEKFDLSVGLEFRRNEIKYSLQQELNQIFHNQVYFIKTGYFPHKKLGLRQSLRYRIYEGDNLGSNQEIPIWNASISYFANDGRLEFKMSAVDLLNKNLGISQRGMGNFIEYRQANTLGRYFLFSITYALKKFGHKQNAISIERF